MTFVYHVESDDALFNIVDNQHHVACVSERGDHVLLFAVGFLALRLELNVQSAEVEVECVVREANLHPLAEHVADVERSTYVFKVRYNRVSYLCFWCLRHCVASVVSAVSHGVSCSVCRVSHP